VQDIFYPVDLEADVINIVMSSDDHILCKRGIEEALL